MIVQLMNISEVHILYVNQTTNRQPTATVIVEEKGTYHVTIFAITGDRGILDSDIEYSVSLSVEETDDQSDGTSPEAEVSTAFTTTSMVTNLIVLERDLPIRKKQKNIEN